MTKELLVATTVRIGDILEMGHLGFPVLGTVPVAPLFVTVRAEGGAGDLEHGFAMNLDQLKQLRDRAEAVLARYGRPRETSGDIH